MKVKVTYQNGWEHQFDVNIDVLMFDFMPMANDYGRANKHGRVRCVEFV